MQMPDKYRRQLSSYQPKTTVDAFQLPINQDIDPEKLEALIEIVKRDLRKDKRFNDEYSVERRANNRNPFPKKMLVTPCSSDGQPEARNSITVVGRDLSGSGVAFVHSRDVREGRFVMTFKTDSNQTICLLSEVKRCDPFKNGLYMIGCEFTERIPLHANHESDKL